MKIYLAHNFAARDWLKTVLPKVVAAGHESVASWIVDDSHLHSKNAQESAEADVADIKSADVIILFTDQFAERTGKGKFFEFGLAYALRKLCLLVGQDTSCIFSRLSAVRQFLTIEDALDYLSMKGPKRL